MAMVESVQDERATILRFPQRPEVRRLVTDRELRRLIREADTVWVRYLATPMRSSYVAVPKAEVLRSLERTPGEATHYVTPYRAGIIIGV